MGNKPPPPVLKAEDLGGAFGNICLKFYTHTPQVHPYEWILWIYSLKYQKLVNEGILILFIVAIDTTSVPQI